MDRINRLYPSTALTTVRRSSVFRYGMVLLGAMSTLGLNGCSSVESSAEDTASSNLGEAAVSSRVVNVEVTPVETATFTDYIRITGEAEALHDVTVTAEEGGVILQFFVVKGSTVRRGQPIAKLKDDVLTAQVAEAEAVAHLAREQFKRQEELWRKDKIGSELAYLQVKSATDGANARLDMLKVRLANTTVRSPIDGIFDEQYLEVGEMAAPGLPLVRILNTDQVKITGGVPERFALSVHSGDSAWITFDIFPNQRLVGRIDYVGSAVNPANRTFPVEIVLDNKGRLIKPHMVAKVQLVREHLEDAIIIPRQVVERTENGHRVYLAQPSEGGLAASARYIELGPAHRNRIVVQSGLAVGELLITLGHQQVDDGSPIRLVNIDAVASAGEHSE